MGFVDRRIQSIARDQRIAGTSVTLALPGMDSTLLHHVAQVLRPGDVVVADYSGVLVVPPSEAPDDVDWALGKAADEPEAHRRMQAGEKLGDRSGATRIVEEAMRR